MMPSVAINRLEKSLHDLRISREVLNDLYDGPDKDGYLKEYAEIEEKIRTLEEKMRTTFRRELVTGR